MTALKIAQHLGKKIGVIDTEHGSASKYADEFAFDVIELESFSPQSYIEALKALESNGYDVIIVDSLSHAWMGKGGALEMVDKAAKRMQSNNSYVAWRDVTPLHNELVETMIRLNTHLIVTMRAKSEYVLEKDEKGKTVPRKIGMAAIQRDGLEYEFDVVCDLDIDNNLIVGKTRCPRLRGMVVREAGKEVADIFLGWLQDGTKEPGAVVGVVTPVESKAVDEITARVKACKTLDELREVWKESQEAMRELTDDERDQINEAKEARKASLAPKKEVAPAPPEGRGQTTPKDGVDLTSTPASQSDLIFGANGELNPPPEPAPPAPPPKFKEPPLPSEYQQSVIMALRKEQSLGDLLNKAKSDLETGVISQRQFDEVRDAVVERIKQIAQEAAAQTKTKKGRAA